MNWDTVRHNDFTSNLGTDWIAVDANGNPIARAGDEDAVKRAAPDAAGYLQVPELDPHGQPATGGTPVPDPAFAAFDHDGDGHPGGSLKHQAEDAGADGYHDTEGVWRDKKTGEPIVDKAAPHPLADGTGSTIANAIGKTPAKKAPAEKARGKK